MCHTLDPSNPNLERVQAKEKRQAKEAQVSKAQMDAARRGGVSWGMSEDAALEEDLDNITEGNNIYHHIYAESIVWVRIHGQKQSLGTRHSQCAAKFKHQNP